MFIGRLITIQRGLNNLNQGVKLQNNVWNIKRENLPEVYFKLPDHPQVLHLIQKVNETLWKAIETLSQQLCYFH